MSFLRRPLLSVTALVLYLAVNVPVRGLHHHAHDNVAATSSAATSTRLSIDAAPASDDPSADHVCSVCSVLHLAQTLPVAIDLTVHFASSGRALALAPVLRPHLFESLAHSRAPPAV